MRKWILQTAAGMLALVLCVNFSILADAEEAAGTRVVRIPYGYNDFLKVDDFGNVSGYYAEYLEELAKINDWEYEYVKTTWPQAVEMLESGEIDFLYPTNYSEERDEFMDFSTLPTGFISVGIFALADSGYQYADYASFDGARIAYVKESSNGPELEAFARLHGFSFETVGCSTNYEIIQKLVNGEADLAVFNAATSFPGGVLVSVMRAQPVYFAVHQGNTDILSRLDSGMQELLRLEPGLVSDTLRKTMLGDVAVSQALTEEERTFMDSGEEITVGFYEDSEPLAYIDESGAYDGIYIEFLEHFREKSGLNLVPCPISRDKDWKDLVKSGEIDFYIGASDLAVLQDNELCITNSFMEYTNVLVTRNDCAFNQLDVPVIAMTSGIANWADYLQKKLGREIDVRFYQTARECVIATISGETDAALLDNMEFNYQIKNNRFSNLIRWPQYRFPAKITLAASKQIDNVMLSTVNKALGLIDPDYIDEVTDEYLNIPYHSYSVQDYIYNSRHLLMTICFAVVMSLIIAVLLAVFRGRQRKLREEAQEREMHQLQILSALSREYAGVYFTDLDKDQCEVLQAAEGNVSGVPGLGTHSGSLRTYVEEHVLPEFQEMLRPLCDPKEIIKLFQKEKDFSVRYKIIPEEGSLGYCELHFVDVSMNNREHKMVFGIRSIDAIVREEQRQQQILQDALDGANRANAAKTDFFSMMSHDIRTPMNAIIGMTAIAGAHIDEPERVRDALGKIANSSNYLLSLINDVLDMSKIEAGGVSLGEEDISLTKLLNGLLDMIRPQIKEHHHKLKVDIHDIKHDAVIGDSLRIQQVFMNLISNAIKYTPDGGEISITVSEKPVNTSAAGCYEIIIADNGIGMSEEYLSHIFEPFKRAEDLRTSKIQGTGLGLSITKNIVQMMNGTLEVQSELDKGSVFTMIIFLKFQNTESEPAAESVDNASEPGKIPTGNYAGKRVLLVEDNELNREIAREILEMSELSVEEAEDGQSAVSMFSASENGFYDMILMDIQMPGMNGYDATRAIRQLNRPDAGEVPIVAVTADVFMEDIRTAKAAGMNDHLSKPINFEQLNRILKKYLG